MHVWGPLIFSSPNLATTLRLQLHSVQVGQLELPGAAQPWGSQSRGFCGLLSCALFQTHCWKPGLFLSPTRQAVTSGASCDIADEGHFLWSPLGQLLPSPCLQWPLWAAYQKPGHPGEASRPPFFAQPGKSLPLGATCLTAGPPQVMGCWEQDPAEPSSLSCWAWG